MLLLLAYVVPHRNNDKCREQLPMFNTLRLKHKLLNGPCYSTWLMCWPLRIWGDVFTLHNGPNGFLPFHRFPERSRRRRWAQQRASFLSPAVAGFGSHSHSLILLAPGSRPETPLYSVFIITLEPGPPLLGSPAVPSFLYWFCMCDFYISFCYAEEGLSRRLGVSSAPWVPQEYEKQTGSSHCCSPVFIEAPSVFDIS